MNFCTYFDSKYFPQGMALIASLRKWAPDFHLDVLALDRHTADRVPVGPQVTVYYDGDVTGRENIFRITPRWVKACLSRYSAISYIDADCFFFSVPKSLPGHLGIIPHRWTPKYADRLRGNGTYNVGMVSFDLSGKAFNTVEAGTDVHRCIADWQAWCDAGNPDQPHLDRWPHEYGATVCHDLGYNLAPYNQEQYTYSQDARGINVSNGAHSDRLTFYHFHEWHTTHHPNDSWTMYRTGYPLHPFVAEVIYQQYEKEVMRHGP